MSEPWSQQRREELIRLQELLNECRLTNAGNNILGRLARIIELAEGLSQSEVGKLSFSSFLARKACGEDFE